jgi:CRP-like cAMP-binding protein
MSAPAIQLARSNRLLATLPASTFNALMPILAVQQLTRGTLLYERGKPMPAVWFPLTGVASLVTEDDAGNAIEVATVGFESMVGATVILDPEQSVHRVIYQVPGMALRAPLSKFTQVLSREPALSRALGRCVQVLISQMSQSAACNRLHLLETRCARWLLETHDRAKSDYFELTHDYLGLMLGVRRASVSTAAADLQSKGLITYSRGTITIKDRRGLEKAACSCYGIIAKEVDRLLFTPASRRSKGSQ